MSVFVIVGILILLSPLWVTIDQIEAGSDLWKHTGDREPRPKRKRRKKVS